MYVSDAHWPIIKLVIKHGLISSLIHTPQNRLLPASDRMPPQTDRQPTGQCTSYPPPLLVARSESSPLLGPFDRERLMHHLKKEAIDTPDRDDFVPFVKKTGGKVYKSQQEPVSYTHLTLPTIYSV